MDIVKTFKNNLLTTVATGALSLLSLSSVQGQKKESYDKLKKNISGDYIYNPNARLSDEDQKEFKKAYKKTKVVGSFIYSNKKYKSPTKEQVFLKSLVNTVNLSETGEYLTKYSQRRFNKIGIDSSQTSLGRFISHSGAKDSGIISLRGDFIYNDLDALEKKEEYAHNVMTLIEELIHSYQHFEHDALFENPNNKSRLYPESYAFYKLSSEAAAKTLKIMVMHELKQKDYNNIWEYAKEDMKGSPIDGMMDYYDSQFNKNMSEDSHTLVLSTIYQNIFMGDQLRSRYSIGHNEFNYKNFIGKKFRHLSKDEVIGSGYVPNSQSKANFIAVIDNPLKIANRSYSKNEYAMIKAVQDSVKNHNPNFIGNTFSMTVSGDYRRDDQVDYRKVFKKSSEIYTKKKAQHLTERPKNYPTLDK